MKHNFKMNSFIQFILLMGVWLLMSGKYDLFHTSMGVLSSLMVMALHIKLRKHYDLEDQLDETDAKLKGIQITRLRYGRLLFYIPWLIWQIVIASLQVAVAVLNPKLKIDPAMVHFKSRLPNDAARVILGNSITLTPGTITVEIDDHDFLVHSLMDASASGILDGSLPGEVAKLYEKKPDQVVKSHKIIKSSAEL